ncbi:CLUMA_CG010606, isoform A [Clunio marinus]|uniref:CLUMA_CG010606, isoform A n=1 Tax=Clunio marinus TaxID=568069 RepID=A0A1J1IFH9_9DIPT|nr:CLUMA_CG010606, isoform A [Clunio marinus]
MFLLQTTRSPSLNLYEISPRPFGVTTSPLQNRGHFGSFGQTATRQNSFGFNPNYNFQSTAQRQNPYLDTSGFSEVPLLDDYEEGERQQQSFVPTTSRGRGSAERVGEPSRSNFNVPHQQHKTNRERLIDKLKVRPITTTPEPVTTTQRAVREQQQPSKKSRYSPITRSTTSKRPQPVVSDSDGQHNDQKFSFTKSNKVKSLSRDLIERPINQYRVNITHSGEDEKKSNQLSVKSLDAIRREQSQEVDDGEEYEEYEDEDYGVILTEEDRILKESPTTTVQTTTTPLPETTTTTTTKPEDNTVIIFENFILPNQNEKDENADDDNDDDDEDIEYEYIDEEDYDSTEKPVTTTRAPTIEPRTTTITPEYIEVTTYRDKNRIFKQSVVSLVTSKTTINTSMPVPKNDDIYDEVISTTTEEENYPSSTKPTPKKTTTEDYFVIASVQTSRSVSGAHFLPFEHVEQEERKKSRNELSKKLTKEHDDVTEAQESHTTETSDVENDSEEENDDDDNDDSREITTSISVYDESEESTTTQRNAPVPSTESIIDKLDRVQSDLSLGVLSGEFPVLKDRSSKKSKVTSTKTSKPLTEASLIEVEHESETVIPTTVKPLVLIRKFRPKSTTSTTQKSTTQHKIFVKSTATTTTEEPITTTTQSNSNDKQRENKKIAFDNIEQDDLAGLLPPGYKPRVSFKNKKVFSTTTQQPVVKDDESTGKSRNSTISRSFKPQSNSQLLSPGYKSFKNKDKLSGSKAVEENETQNVLKKGVNKDSDGEIDSKFLPPDFKPVNDSDKLAVIPLERDELSKFLPPGFKLEKEPEKPKIKVVDDDLSKFLPPGFKPQEEENKTEDVLSSILGKIKFQDASDLLPKDFKQAETPVYQPSTTEATTTKSSGKVVFPSRLGKRPGAGRVTTPKPIHAEGPKAPELEIRRGPPTRATTEFTGWPSKATTPISIEKLLELQKNAMEVNISDFLPKSTTVEETTTTTTTTTTTPRPTQPTVCRSDCSLAATIRIIDGVEWSPELLTHHTEEYKNLAAELEIELNEVYRNAPSLKQWFKKVRIDSFSKGSVLVDYFVELSDIPKDINTLEIKRLFHEALIPDQQKSETSHDDGEGLPQPIVKEALKLGNFLVDPVSTDFIVIQKVATPPTDLDDEDNLLPQWAVAMITIGLLSLICVVLFGVTVLVNRKKAAKKKQPTPLTADMLNELNKNHMGGLDNYGAEDLYNLDDTWDERRQDVKPKVKRFSTSGSNPNIYDSWRSQHLQRYQPDEFYYDSHDPFNELQPKYQTQQRDAYSGSKQRYLEPSWQDSAYPPYHGNSSHNYSSRRLRDYDQHF